MEETKPKSWIQINSEWWGRLREEKGFFTPTSLVGIPPINYEFKQRDHVLFQIGRLLITLAKAAEGIRKGTDDQALISLSALQNECDLVIEFIEGNDLSDPVQMTNAECMIGKLMLVGTEVAEAMEDVEIGNYAGFQEELADTYIRLNDLVGQMNIDMDTEVDKKMRANELRPRKHGKLTTL